MKQIKMIVIGIDAAAWSMINKNISEMPNIRKLMKEGRHKTITLNEKPHSAPVWCSMFTGKKAEEHGHKDFVVNGRLQKREDIKAEFIWDVLNRKGIDIRALQIPFVYPPYDFKCKYEPVEYGLATEPDKIEKDTRGIVKEAIRNLKEGPDVFIAVFSALDKISHYYWGSEIVDEWYKKIDKAAGKLISYGEKIIVVSDHGFCSWEESKERTLPRVTKEGREIKGDHKAEAILITKNIKYKINKPQDVFFAIKEELMR